MCYEFDWIIMMSNYSEAVHSQVFVVVVAIFFSMFKVKLTENYL